ncbi:type III-B CRISPR module-associated protein Cmr5 [Allochromatium vinosum]|uniref:CRISPR type III-B/RAMP module-associated protein Cmr5 n=1 Tax=Allochromatium vinosum (strain ATCC 17899 / DSM 180 / NBRC 103801 / NCIMB 10441 / D) TaxID=572477 RepID=D3RW19_ALLVD|nr:type III-B CRISPR module-associated protein Cmr5 [Allochromatium vinosum]ADC64031.1 CRISPR-associated protein, Cmr5 family [Allochromatium vinosum DSM 180]
MKMRAHQVATAAYACVEARKDEPNKKKYGAIAHKLPGMILQNGLAQATGFLLAKGAGAPEHLMLLDDLKEVLRAGGTLTVTSGEALHREIIGADLAKTLKLTRAALEASGWIKRYVQGVLRVTATGDTSNGEEN